MKEAILRQYDISEETYRQLFRTAHHKEKEGEAYIELSVRLQDLLRKWMVGCESVEAVNQKVVNSMPTDPRIWVSERKPRTGTDAEKLADDHLQAQKRESGIVQAEKRETDFRECHQCGQVDHLAHNCRKNKVATPEPMKEKEKGAVKCYNC